MIAVDSSAEVKTDCQRQRVEKQSHDQDVVLFEQLRPTPNDQYQYQYGCPPGLSYVTWLLVSDYVRLLWTIPFMLLADKRVGTLTERLDWLIGACMYQSRKTHLPCERCFVDHLHQ